MKKLMCMITLAAISCGTIFAAAPVKTTSASDTVKVVKKVKNGKTKTKIKIKTKDTTVSKPM